MAFAGLPDLSHSAKDLLLVCGKGRGGLLCRCGDRMPGGFLGKIFSLVVGQEPSCVLSALDAEMPTCLASHVIISHIASGGAHVRRGIKGGELIQSITIEPLIEDSEVIFLR